MAQKPSKNCKYGAKCYRKNKQHLEEYSHPADVASNLIDDDVPKPIKRKIKEGRKADASQVGNKPEEMGSAAEASNIGSASGYKRARQSADRAEDDDAVKDGPPSPKDVKDNIASKFLVKMPEDFYDFWEFVKSLNSKNPRGALSELLGLNLVGPFDILAGEKGNKRTCWLRHWRYYYDPPEFLTVISGDDKKQFHIGYFRDDPKEMPAFVASNSASENGVITPRGPNLFAAVNWCLENSMRNAKGSEKTKLQTLKTKISQWSKDHGYPLELQTKEMKARNKKVVTEAFHKAGIVVPIDDNEVGYRELPETNADLKKMFKKIAESKTEQERDKSMDPLMEIVMLVQFANDECDYGEGLELGLDLFTYGGDCFHKLILNLMPLAYQLLRRNEFGEIIKAHLEDRKHSSDLSQIK